MSSDTPRISIGMPVRNGEKYIRQAIDSILAQSYRDFELIVCDNASTDSTEQIVTDYVAKDSRVRYHRNLKDVGPAGNHNIGLQLARGEYFRWHAHDDMIAPTYLETVIKVLDAEPGVANSHSRTLVVDENGAPITKYEFHLGTNSQSVVRRFASLVLVNHQQHRACEIFGLMRTAALRHWNGEGIYARGDSVLLARMSLLGRFSEVDEPLFQYRSHGSQSVQTLPSIVKRGQSRLARYLGTGPLPPPEWWDSSLKGKIAFPEWRLFREYWISVARAPLTFLQALGCYGVLIAWLISNPHKLARDVLFALEKLKMRLAGELSKDGGTTARSVLPAVNSAGGSAGGGTTQL